MKERVPVSGWDPSSRFSAKGRAAEEAALPFTERRAKKRWQEDERLNTSVAVEMRNITKRFGTVLANDNVSLDIKRGEILALLGENGSGKTTLMNMLAGIYFPDGGTIRVNGEPAVIASPKEAFELGIGMIHQHFKLVDVLTAAENIVLGLEGKLDTITAPDFEKAVKENIEGVEELVFDLEKLEYITSAGLRVLLSAQKTMNEQGTMTVINVNEIDRYRTRQIASGEFPVEEMSIAYGRLDYSKA